MTAVHDDDMVQPCGRFDWERIIRRADLPMRLKYTALTLATYADADGSRVRPGPAVLAAVMKQGESTVRKHLAALIEYGLIALVSRGGGRGGRGKSSEYRLTAPKDLFTRIPMLPPSERVLSIAPVSPLAQESAHSDDETETPLYQESGQSGLSSVDNSDSPVDKEETPLAQESGQTEAPEPNDRSENTVTDGMSARFERLSAPPGEQLPSDQPPKETTTTGHHPTQLTTARDRPAEPPNFHAPSTAADPPICEACSTYLDPDGGCFVCRTGRRNRRGIP
ncbi:hypothetical protein DMC63_01465 [Streptomyces sp. WAC 05977]|nr:hypothetical protein DMC63_01465 [Streptomyces sp. WAC 05977]